MFTIVLLGTMFGLTWAVVASLKDTQVNNSGYMYVKGSSSELVKVGVCHTRASHASQWTHRMQAWLTRSLLFGGRRGGGIEPWVPRAT